MKVKHLIEKLSNLNHELDVFTRNDQAHWNEVSSVLVDVVKEIDTQECWDLEDKVGVEVCCIHVHGS